MMFSKVCRLLVALGLVCLCSQDRSEADTPFFHIQTQVVTTGQSEDGELKLWLEGCLRSLRKKIWEPVIAESQKIGSEHARFHATPRSNPFVRPVMCHVTITGEGAISGVRVVLSSQEKELDDIACNLIRLSSPFSRPPQGYRIKDGLLIYFTENTAGQPPGVMIAPASEASRAALIREGDRAISKALERTYFPWSFGEFGQRWYSGHLAAMKEPVLRKGIQSCDSVYRFLLLPSFDHPVMVRIDVRKGGKPVMVTKVLSGAGGYHPGVLTIDRQTNLSREIFTEFLDKFRKSNFWNMPTEDCAILGNDGSQWILEVYDRGRYHVVDRWEPEAPIYELGSFMMKQSKVFPEGKLFY
ncbi:MAG: energy transducer TonB [Candidatus Obscuribacterales bacterium]